MKLSLINLLEDFPLLPAEIPLHPEEPDIQSETKIIKGSNPDEIKKQALSLVRQLRQTGYIATVSKIKQIKKSKKTFSWNKVKPKSEDIFAIAVRFRKKGKPRIKSPLEFGL